MKRLTFGSFRRLSWRKGFGTGGFLRFCDRPVPKWDCVALKTLDSFNSNGKQEVNKGAGVLTLRVASIGLSALTLACCFTAPAFAEQLDPAGQVQMRVHGDVREQCSMGQPGTVNFGDLNRPGLTADVAIPFDCNVPFDVRLEASNGGLTNFEGPGGQGPYASILPYTLALSLPVRKPNYSVLSRSFESKSLVGAQTMSSGSGIALDGMVLHLALNTPVSDAGLLSGEYSETIVITVSPS